MVVSFAMGSIGATGRTAQEEAKGARSLPTYQQTLGLRLGRQEVLPSELGQPAQLWVRWPLALQRLLCPLRLLLLPRLLRRPQPWQLPLLLLFHRHLFLLRQLPQHLLRLLLGS